MAKYSITPLNTGHFPDLSKPVLTYMHGFGEAIRVPIVMWAIEDANQRILVDTGSGNPQRALKYHRFLEQNEAERPDQELSRIGWNPEDVSLVVLTHLHWDHCGNNQLFKRARFMVQEDEIRYALSPLRINGGIEENRCLVHTGQDQNL